MTFQENVKARSPLWQKVGPAVSYCYLNFMRTNLPQSTWMQQMSQLFSRTSKEKMTISIILWPLRRSAAIATGHQLWSHQAFSRKANEPINSLDATNINRPTSARTKSKYPNKKLKKGKKIAKIHTYGLAERLKGKRMYPQKPKIFSNGLTEFLVPFFTIDLQRGEEHR